jgi:glucose-1-phosphate cytidylyltransferase
MKPNNENLATVILCGGKGSRLYPFSEYFPKPMMPVNGRPILVHLMQVYARQGYRRFVLAAGHRKEILLDYFHGRFSDWDVTILDTGPDSDTGRRICACCDHVGDRFLVTYGDGLGNVKLDSLVDFHCKSKAAATVTAVPMRSQFGSLELSPAGQVERFVEKPLISGHWVSAGFFVFERKCFESWNGQSLELELLPQLANQHSLCAYLHEGFWKSMDTSKDQQELEALVASGAPPWFE